MSRLEQWELHKGQIIEMFNKSFTSYRKDKQLYWTKFNL
jgi:hypothetical protein